MKPVFSILVPVFDVAGYLGECLDSVLAQTFIDWEAICVDDGSTDGSGAILDGYAARDARFKVIHQENKGVSAARNAALEVACGEWIIFVDADDLLRESALSDIAAIAQAHPEARQIFFEKCEFGEKAEYEELSGGSEAVDLAREIPSRFADYSFCQCAYRRDLAEKLRFRPYVVGEDLLFLCEALAREKKCIVLRRQEYANRIRPGSASRSAASFRKIWDLTDCLADMMNVLDGSGKKIGAAFSRGRGNGLIEGVPSDIMSIGGANERKALLSHWFDALGKVRGLGVLSPWQRLAARAVFATRSATLARFLCVLPHRLKGMGLHR